MEDKIRQILELAIRAPSGENCQPWKFQIQGNQLTIWNMPERDSSLYSWGQRPSYVAHGAFLESVAIAAPAFGLSPRIELFPDSTKTECVARIVFEESQQKIHPLYQFITERVTNRKVYKKIVLTKEQKEELSSIHIGLERGKIIFVEQEQDIKTIAQAIAGNERIIFENPYMHKFFYDHITWTEQEDLGKKIGFYVKTFELPMPAEKIFKLAKSKTFVKFANKIGFSKMIAKQNAKVYSSASAVGAIIMYSNSSVDFIVAGRLIQRIWLTVTKLGLSLQPLTGILFLYQRVSQQQTDKLSPGQIDFIQEQYKRIKETFGVDNETIAMLFRIGDGGSPTARSLRLPLTVQEF
ncbi:MAG: hypothetical protein G01um101430_100 [Parcubacteria group bacterium Gr01-1014_30]|nr:MAG: hypothetical protein G01um101430_100 [Parcubacteria group bacterium Gr01-1014_30]